jgi:outer membrane receptor protein involved in Fe transport
VQLKANPMRMAVRRALQAGAIATVAGHSSIALSQDQLNGPSQARLEEVVVTGSRIIRQDYSAASPVVTVDAEQFRQTGTLNAEELMNTLPQVVPHFSSGNNNPGNGQSYIDLRGLGEERNLVLVDGIRMVPSNEDAVVDINTIPTALISRVEVLSGGASAAYGSDAVSGATNFILRDDIDGVEINFQTGESGEGDTGITSIELLMGSDLADGRGNVVAWATYNDRERLGKGDRAFSAQAVSQTSFFPSGHVRRAAGNSWTLDAVQDVFTNLYGAAAPSTLGTLVGNDDGTLFTQGGAGEGVINFREVIGQDINGNFVAQNFLPDEYSYNFEPFNNLIIPQERLNLGGMLNLDLSDNFEVFNRLFYTNYSSDTRLAPTPAPTSRNITNPDAGFEFTVPATNPFVQANAGLSQLLASRTGDNAGLGGWINGVYDPNASGADEDFIYRRRFIENGPRIESYERDVFQWVGGIRGDLSDNWSLNAYLAKGKYNEQLKQDGNVSTTRVENLLDAPDGGVSICAGGLNPIGANTLSADCADYVAAAAKNNTRVEHNHAEAVVSGDIFPMPGGSASLAVGAFWQEYNFQFIADELLASGDVSGFNAEDNIIGRTSNTDLFAELYLPLTNSLDLNLGVRSSDHSVSDRNTSYKAEMNWSISDGFGLRGSYQRAVRAPNVGELFEPQVEDNPDVNDPCNFDSGFRTGGNAAAVRDLCLAQGILSSEIDTYSQTTDQISAFQGGNPDLKEETADTFTVGFVWQPADLDRLQLSVDYYEIEIEDVISFVDPSIVVNKCFNGDGSNPGYAVSNEWCQKFGRSPTSGEIIDLLELQENIAGLRTDGVDVQVDWGIGLGNAGDFGLNFVSTFVNEHSESQQPGDPFIDFVGSIGDNEGEALPDFKATLSATWDFRKFATLARIRYIPSMIHEEAVLTGSSDESVCDCTGVGSVVYMDLTTRYSFSDRLSFRFGIQNVTDEAPQLYTPDQDSGTNASVYDVIGRRWFLAANVTF